MIDDEPTLADVDARFPQWEVWRGIDGLFHARIRGANPPVLVRGESPDDLSDQIVRWERLNDAG